MQAQMAETVDGTISDVLLLPLFSSNAALELIESIDVSSPQYHTIAIAIPLFKGERISLCLV